MPVILATWEAEVARLWAKVRDPIKNKLKKSKITKDFSLGSGSSGRIHA
jgi:hypothetical protein